MRAAQSVRIGNRGGPPAFAPVILLAHRVNAATNANPRILRDRSDGSGIGVEENWIPSSMLEVSQGTAKRSSPDCPAYGEMSMPHSVYVGVLSKATGERDWPLKET